MARLFAALRLPGWLRPPARTVDGTMSLFDHLRELRYRVVFSSVAIVLAASLASLFYGQLLDVVMWPWEVARADLVTANPDVQTAIVNQGVTAPFVLALKVSVVAGVLLSCPLWLYQLWSFIVPALKEKERLYALRFLAAAVPLFLLGCTFGYWVLPKGISVMLQFTPAGLGIVNLLEINQFLTLELILVLVFGLSFLLPVVLVMLNFAGVVKAKQLAASRTYAIFGIAVFSAIATPSTDPFSMLALAVPMAVLYLVAEVISRVHDARLQRAEVQPT